MGGVGVGSCNLNIEYRICFMLGLESAIWPE